VGVVAAIDVGIDTAVAEKGEMAVGGDIAERVDSSGLDLAVPDIAIDVG